MHQDALIGLALIVVLGVCAQWLAWRLRLPSILLLLAAGFVAGPLSGRLDPDALFGDLLFPFVSISVAVILYEGGLTLRLADLPKVGSVVRNLVTVGAAVTFGLTGVAAHTVLRLDWSLSFLLGAVLTVTGPTVIVPLLRHVRPKGTLSAIIKWEGIIIDPIGALLALLVYEAIIIGTMREATRSAGVSIVLTVFAGGGLGVAAALLLAVLFSRHLVPDFLDNAVSLMLVVATFTLSNMVQPESGLLAVTVMGFVLANQRRVDIKHIIDFKENLRVLLISTLFILLSARLNLDRLGHISPAAIAFVGVLIFIVRPAAVWVSTLGSKLNFKERVFLSWMAPRGIVAAAVASIFALQLEETNPAAAVLVTYTLLTIVITVAVYGLTAAPLARMLGLSDDNPQGVLFIGAHHWARAIAEVLKREGVRVQMIDTNRANVVAARMADLPTYFGSVLSEHAPNDVDLDGIGRLLAVTPNDGINTLAGQALEGAFGRANVYRLTPMKEHVGAKPLSIGLRGRKLFNPDATFPELDAKFAAGWTVRASSITEEFDVEALRKRFGRDLLPLFVLSETGKLRVIAADEPPPEPRPGDTLIALTRPKDAAPQSEGHDDAEDVLNGDEPIM